jgi:threonyl-tRNA synthetase
VLRSNQMLRAVSHWIRDVAVCYAPPATYSTKPLAPLFNIELQLRQRTAGSSMPPPRSAFAFFQAFRRAQLISGYARRHGRISSRGCSSSANEDSPEFIKLPKSLPKQDLIIPPTDHRTLAQAHDLFITSPYSPGSPLLLPNGAYIFQKLQSFLRAQYPQFGFKEVITPTIYKKSLWEQSGHWENYAEDMFSVQGRGATGQLKDADAGQDEEFGLKPMNCPGHCLLFSSDIKSYKDLPVRYADFSALHRNEISGALTGLTRVRRFHQDDAHIFCRADQILSEIEQTLRFVEMVYNTFGLGPYKMLLSTRPKNHYIGTVEEWDRAEEQLTTALNNSGREWKLNKGDGAFYGPKIDIILKDATGKEHQTATIQLDFQLPQRFSLQYQPSPQERNSKVASLDSSGLDQAVRRPVMIHRAIYGSIERFMALLIEHYGGTYPFWLSPRPAIILSLNQDPETLNHISHLHNVLSGLKLPQVAPGLESRPVPQALSTIQLPIDVDRSARGIGKKIASARGKKYNHIIVVGSTEVRSGGLSIEIAAQPNPQSSKEVLESAIGREIERKGNRKSIVHVDAQQARAYFEGLVNKYL